MAHETSVISQLFKKKFLASHQWILDVDNYTNITVGYIGYIVLEMRRILAANG
jgi:hypothetical protein